MPRGKGHREEAGDESAGPQRELMPLTIFDTKGISATRRERIEGAVEFGGKHLAAPHEAWIATDQETRIRVIITGPQGFQRTVTFAPDEPPGHCRIGSNDAGGVGSTLASRALPPLRTMRCDSAPPDSGPAWLSCQGMPAGLPKAATTAPCGAVVVPGNVGHGVTIAKLG